MVRSLEDSLTHPFTPVHARSRASTVLPSRRQSIGSSPASTRAALVRENGREPKNPLEADNGDGCADSITVWRVVSTTDGSTVGFYFYPRLGLYLAASSSLQTVASLSN